MEVWQHPPLEERVGNADGDFSIAYVYPDMEGHERSGVFKRTNHEGALDAAFLIVSFGGNVCVYDKKGGVVWQQ